MTFQIHGLPAKTFNALFELSDEDLENRQMTRCSVDAAQGYPCRVSLTEAVIGDDVILLNYEHLTLASPYRASHAIYVANGSQDAVFGEGEIPQSLKLRPLSLRAFGADGSMIDADLADHETVSDKLSKLLSNATVAFVHIHNAKQGCYAALATRPGEFDPEWHGANAPNV